MNERQNVWVVWLIFYDFFSLSLHLYKKKRKNLSKRRHGNRRSKKPFNDFYSMPNKFAKTHKERFCLCWLEIINFLATQNKAKKLAMKRLFLSPRLMILRAIKRSIYICVANLVNSNEAQSRVLSEILCNVIKSVEHQIIFNETQGRLNKSKIKESIN